MADRTKNINKAVHYRIKRTKHKPFTSDYSPFVKIALLVSALLTFIAIILFKN